MTDRALAADVHALAAALDARADGATLADLVVATGLPDDRVATALGRLLTDRDGTVEPREGDGALVVRLGVGPLSRADTADPPGLRAALATFGLGSALMLYGAVVLFILAGFALQQGSQDAVERWKALFRRRRPGDLGPPTLRERLTGFTLGADAVLQDRTALDREALALARARGGVLTDVDLILLHGLDRATAAREVTRIGLSFGGQPTATEQSPVAFAFGHLAETTGPTPRFDAVRPDLTRAEAAASDRAVLAMSAFNAVVGVLVGAVGLDALFGGNAPLWLEALLGWLPASAGLFAVGVFASRALRGVTARSSERRRLMLRAAVARFCLGSGHAFELPGSERAALGVELASTVDATELRAVLDGLADDLGGDVTSLGGGRRRYAFA